MYNNKAVTGNAFPIMFGSLGLGMIPSQPGSLSPLRILAGKKFPLNDV